MFDADSAQPKPVEILLDEAEPDTLRMHPGSVSAISAAAMI